MKKPTKQQSGEREGVVRGLWMLAMELEGVPLGDRLEALERLAVVIVDAHGTLSRLKKLDPAQQAVTEILRKPKYRPKLAGIKVAVRRAEGGSRG